MSDREITGEEGRENEAGSNIGWFVAGVALGMVAAALLAPASGKETRQFITDRTQQGRDAVTGTGKDVFERSKEVIEKGRQLVEDAVELFERGRKLVRG
jgi:gas vesicle protein